MERETELILGYFNEICKIPRPSGKEQAICRYLKLWAENCGFSAAVDNVGNLIIECEAKAGFEDKPLIILQAHMDMVCLAEDGIDYNAERDGIKTYIEGDFLKAYGTSLGGDDGIGIATAQFLAADFHKRGPLRLIFTADEEMTTVGAVELDEKFLKADYLINLDSEESDKAVISSAGCVEMCCSANREEKNSMLEEGFDMEICGLIGGHSGDNINMPRANGILVLCRIINALNNNISWEICELKGGNASNAIPIYAHIKGNTSNFSEFCEQANRIFANIIKEYTEEKEVRLEIKPTNTNEKTISSNIIDFILELPNGVLSKSEFIEDFVTASSNLGLVEGDSDNKKTKVTILARSEREQELLNITNLIEKISDKYSIEYERSELTPSWEANKESRITKLLQKAYFNITGENLPTKGVHSVLECAEFRHKNKHLDMVSISPDVYDVHSPKERLYMPSVEKIKDVLKELLENIE